MSKQQQLFLAIRNETLVQNVTRFTTDDFHPFLPWLVYSFFGNKSSHVGLQSEDEIISRLIRSPSANDINALLKLDYESLRSKFKDIQNGMESLRYDFNYSQSTLQKKAQIVGSHLISKVKNTPVNMIDSFEPFDVENYQEEIIWIISVLSMKIPEYFDVLELVPVLLSYTHGQQILLGILLNHPSVLDQVLDKVLSLENSGSGSPFTRRRKDTIIALLQLDPLQTDRLLRSSLTIPTRMNICIDILCNKNLVDDQFFVNTLIVHLLNTKGAFYQSMRTSNRDFVAKIRNRFDEILQTQQMHSMFKERVVLLMAVLLDLNILRGSVEITHQWVEFLTNQTLDDLRIVKMALAVILACPNLLLPNQHAFRDGFVEQKLTEFFSFIRAKTEIGDPIECGPLNRFMLLAAIHMQTNDGKELSKLLSDELSFNVGDTLAKHVTVKMLFLRYAMAENVIAQKALLLDVTRNLNANVSGYLPVHCVNQLLLARTFSKHKLNIQSWIKRQLHECQLPIHPFMVQVLENFAASCFPTNEDSNHNAQIEEEFFWKIFSADLFSDDKALASKVLALLYLLAFTHRLEISPSTNTIGSKGPVLYSNKLWAEVPIRYILSVIDARPADFEHVRTNLLHHVGTIMPHIGLPTLEASIDRTEDELAVGTSISSMSVPEEVFRKALENIQSDPERFAVLVKAIHAAPIREQHAHHKTIIRSMLVSLEEGVCSANVTLQLTEIWCRLANLIPQELYEQTMQLWLSTKNATDNGTIKISNEILIEETPEMMFRVDCRIFKSPPHFKLLMQVLLFYFDANKNSYNVQLKKAAAMKEKKADLDEKCLLTTAYAGAQGLLIIQLLLGICMKSQAEDPNMKEIRRIACEHIHRMFVGDKHLPLLVHFNMYSVELIPMVVEHVPSMHVLFNPVSQISQLMQPAHLQRRIFTTNLVVELAAKYTVRDSIEAVDYVEDVITTLLRETINEDTIIFFLHTVGALCKLKNFGPPHTDFVEQTLERVKSIAKARAALYSSGSALFMSPERQLISKIDVALSI